MTTGRTTGAGPARRARGEQTRRRLLDAGRRVLDEVGYHAARVDDIVKAANTSHGTFYLYFANKDELFEALILDATEGMLVLAQAFPAAGDGSVDPDALRAWVGAFTELHRASFPVLRAWTEADARTHALRDRGAEVIRAFATALDGAMPPGAGSGADRAVAALALFAMMERLNFYRRSQPLPFGDAAMVDTLTRLILRATTA